MFDILPWKRKTETPDNELRRKIENMYDRFFEPQFLPSSYLFGKGKWDLTVDISEGRKDITVKAEIPGIEAKDLDISIDGRLLTIKGKKNSRERRQKRSIIVSKGPRATSTGRLSCLRQWTLIK